MLRPASILLAGILLAVSQPVFAQDTEYQLGEIVVETEKPGVNDVTNVTEVTAEDIESRGATTLNEAIEMLPGVYIRTAADGTPRIDIRGQRTRHVKLLVNGVPYQSTYDGQFDPAAIPANIISRIVLTKGASSVLYGAGGTAAVMNIITKGAEDGLHGSVGLRAQQNDAYLGKATISGASDKGYFFGSVSSLNANSYPVSGSLDETTVQDSGSRENSDRKRNAAFFNGAYHISDKTELGAVFSISEGGYGKPPSIFPDSSSAGDFGKSAKYERLEHYGDGGAQLNLHHEFDLPLTMDLAVYGNQRTELTKAFSDDSYSTTTGRDSSTSAVGGTSLRGTYDFGTAGSLALALSGESQQWEQDGYSINSKKKKTTFALDNVLQEYSTGLEYTISPIDTVTLVAGGGYVAQTGPDSETATDWTYLLGVNWYPIEGTTIAVNHGRKVRFASIRNLFDATSGNADLSPEVARHYELSLTQDLPFKTVFTGSVYRSDVSDMIEKDDATDIYKNYEKYLLQGFELGLENRFYESFWVRASYAYLHSEDKSDDSNRDELQYRPRDTVNMEAQYTCPFGTKIYGALRYFAHHYTYNDDATLKKAMNNFAVVDMKVSQPLLDDSMNIYAGVNNLFDENYEESYGFPLAGRTLYCGIDYFF